MIVTLYGVRGSIPTTSPDTTYYGGSTSCVEVVENGWQLVLDGGSGIQQLGVRAGITQKRIDILLTHLHLDHIQGLGFFKPLFDPTMEVHIWGPANQMQSLHGRLSRYLSPPLFPVLIRDLPCKLMLHEVENNTFSIGPFNIQSAYIIHPGPTVGFRVNGQHSVLTYLPDHEPALGPTGMISDKRWISGIDLAEGADLLIHDAQYTAWEYPSKKGWGHSSMDDAGQFAALAGVKQVLFTHHDPSRTDSQLTELFTDFKTRNRYSFRHEPAREGMVIELT